MALPVGLSLVACNDPAPATSDPSPTESAEDSYVRFIRDRVPGSAGKSDAEIVAGGKAICAELEGKTVDELGQMAVLLGLDMQEFADSLVGSINTFCPEYDHLLD